MRYVASKDPGVSKLLEKRSEIVRFLKESDVLSVDMTTLDTILLLSSKIEKYLCKLIEQEATLNGHYMQTE